MKVRTSTCAGARAGRVEALASLAGGMEIASGTCSGCINRHSEKADAERPKRNQERETRSAFGEILREIAKKREEGAKKEAPAG
jgi:hypothetical protein